MGTHFFVPSTKTWAEKNGCSIISPSDGDTSEEEEFSRIFYTNNPTVVEEVDKISNSSNPNYTQLVSVSHTKLCNYPM